MELGSVLGLKLDFNLFPELMVETKGLLGASDTIEIMPMAPKTIAKPKKFKLLLLSGPARSKSISSTLISFSSNLLSLASDYKDNSFLIPLRDELDGIL